MSGRKRMSLTESLGAVVASQAAGVARMPEMNFANMQNGQQQQQSIKNWDEYELEWDDEEERRYRDWLKEVRQSGKEEAAEWSELDDEVAYREKLRREAEERAGQEISWDDSQEKEFRRKYAQLSYLALLQTE